MDASRLINIVLTDMSLENLKLQEDLELTINSPEEIDKKIKNIKTQLKNIALNELMISKFQSLMETNNNTK
jgi:hypothetical protein